MSGDEELLVKVLHVEIEILVAVEPQHMLDDLDRNSLGTRSLGTPIKESVVVVLPESPPPSPHAPRRHAQNLGHLEPFDLTAHRPKDHFLNFHRPLRFPGRIESHA